MTRRAEEYGGRKTGGPRLLLAETPGDAAGAKTLAEELGLETVSDPRGTEGEDVWLVLDTEGLALTDGTMTLMADMTHLIPRLRPDRLGAELLVKAAGRVRDGGHPLAVDAAAGFGEDALLLAAAGYRVLMFERDPVIAALLADALARAERIPALSEAVSRMCLRREDSLPALEGLEEIPAVIYLDPMFPEKRKSGLTGKKFQLLHRIAGPCDQEEQLLRASWNAGPGRVVVKRPLKGPYLAGVHPAWSLKGKTVRYDCLIPSGKPI